MTQKHVTLVITHAIRPEHVAQYEAWLGEIMPVAASYPATWART